MLMASWSTKQADSHFRKRSAGAEGGGGISVTHGMGADNKAMCCLCLFFIALHKIQFHSPTVRAPTELLYFRLRLRSPAAYLMVFYCKRGDGKCNAP